MACQSDRGSANSRSSYSHAGSLTVNLKLADLDSLTASTTAVHARAHHRAAAVANRHRHARAARITRLGAAHGLANRCALLHLANHRSCHCGAAEQPIAAGTTARGIEDQNSHCDKQQSLFHHLHCPHKGDAPFTWFAWWQWQVRRERGFTPSELRFLHTTIAPGVAFGNHRVAFLPHFLSFEFVT